MLHVMPVAYGILCGIVGAGIAIVSKLMSPDIPPLIKVFLRFFIGGLCVIPFLSSTEFKKVTKRQFFLFAVMGFTFVVIFNVLFFSALQYIDPMTSALILSAQPIIALLASALLFAHRPTKRVLAGFMLAFIGVALVITKGQLSWDIFSGSYGEFLMLAAVAGQVVYTLILRNLGTHFSPPFISFAISTSGLLFLLPLIASKANLHIITQFSARDWLAMSYIGSVGTALGVVLFALSVKHLGPALGSLIVFSTLPIATIIYSCIIGQTPNNFEFFGSVFVLLGLILSVNIHKKLPATTLVE